MWYMAGREAGPTITIDSPEKYVGRATPLSVSVGVGDRSAGPYSVEQNGKAGSAVGHEDGNAGG